MVKYIEISNMFKACNLDAKGPISSSTDPTNQAYIFFIADTTLMVEISSRGVLTLKINQIPIEIATIFFNPAISFVPCFKYVDSQDVILFTSKNLHYLVDSGGQFNENYYGMKHNLIDCISSEEIYVDLNDEHVFKSFKLAALLTESKTVVYSPFYRLQLQSRQQLINLLNYAIYIRNLSFFILVLFYLRRCSVKLEYHHVEKKIKKITGPWLEAIKYVLGHESNAHYEKLFADQFFDLESTAIRDMPLAAFVDVLCKNFTEYQQQFNGQFQIVPTDKQKQFLQRIVKAPECFHFSEVGSGKTKVILPLLCPPTSRSSFCNAS